MCDEASTVNHLHLLRILRKPASIPSGLQGYAENFRENPNSSLACLHMFWALRLVHVRKQRRLKSQPANAKADFLAGKELRSANTT